MASRSGLLDRRRHILTPCISDLCFLRDLNPPPPTHTHIQNNTALCQRTLFSSLFGSLSRWVVVSSQLLLTIILPPPLPTPPTVLPPHCPPPFSASPFLCGSADFPLISASLSSGRRTSIWGQRDPCPLNNDFFNRHSTPSSPGLEPATLETSRI